MHIKGVIPPYWYKSMQGGKLMDMYNLKQIPTETKIRKYLKTAIFGGKYPFCPQCGKTNPVVYEDRYRCRRCRLKFSVTSHTWLNSLRLPLQQWWMLLWCWTKRIPVAQTQALTGFPRRRSGTGTTSSVGTYRRSITCWRPSCSWMRLTLRTGA